MFCSNKVKVEVDRAKYAYIEHFAQMHIKFETVDKKFKPAIVLLPPESRKTLKKAKEELGLGD